MIITDQLFSAFLKCPTKCWLRKNGEGSIENNYSAWLSARDGAYREQSVTRMMARVPASECVISPVAERLKSDGWRVAIDIPIRTSDLETCVHAVYCNRPTGRGHAIQYVPTRFTPLNKLGPHDKLLLTFDALIVEECVGSAISSGSIIHGDNHTTTRVRTSAFAGKVKDLVAKALVLISSASPPDLVLNRHCTEREFQGRCRQKALEKDDLSLLSGMTEKERRKLNAKGIFTVTQLSYTFRPRRRPKRRRREPEKYQHALRALAISDRNIYFVGIPELKIDGTPVYLDVEGLPDGEYYYLIGIRIGCGESAVQHSLWADDVSSERPIWNPFLQILASIERPILLHYPKIRS